MFNDDGLGKAMAESAAREAAQQAAHRIAIAESRIAALEGKLAALAAADKDAHEAQDARDLLAETTALMLAAICDYQGLHQRGGGSPQTLVQDAVGDLRRITGREIVEGKRP